MSQGTWRCRIAYHSHSVQPSSWSRRNLPFPGESRTSVKVPFVIIIALAVLYPTIWPHEVGHGVAPYLYGCKKTFWRTDTSWFLLSSWSGKDIDYKCMHRRAMRPSPGAPSEAWR